MSTDYRTPRTGIVQYFIRHKVHVTSTNSSEENNIDIREHIFTFVKWMEEHRHTNYYGQSASLSTNMYEALSMCSFIPVQRIACLTTSSVLKVKLGNIEESVFVSCPIPIDYYL